MYPNAYVDSLHLFIDNLNSHHKKMMKKKEINKEDFQEFNHKINMITSLINSLHYTAPEVFESKILETTEIISDQNEKFQEFLRLYDEKEKKMTNKENKIIIRKNMFNEVKSIEVNGVSYSYEEKLV